MVLKQNFFNVSYLMEDVVFSALISLLSSGDESAGLAALACTRAWLAALSSLGATFSITLLYSALTPALLQVRKMLLIPKYPKKDKKANTKTPFHR